jgi:ribose transport system permease protein
MIDSGIDFLKRNSSIALAFGIALALYVAGTVQASGFASYAHTRTILITASFIGLVGLGQTFCILTGGIDLSIPATVAGSAVLTAYLAEGDSGKLVWILPVVLGFALLVGLINGLGIAYAGVPPIIMTLGMNSALQGLLLVYTNGGITSAPPQSLIDFVNSNTIRLSTDLLIWIVVIALATVVLSFSVFGRKLYAVGTNPTAAFLAGVDVRRVLLVPYLLSAVCGAITGVLLLGFLGQAFINIGDEYLFSSAVAVAVGGASILGGRGHYIGTVAGAIILTLIAANLQLLSLGTAALQISYGVILLGTVYLSGLRLGRR